MGRFSDETQSGLQGAGQTEGCRLGSGNYGLFGGDANARSDQLALIRGRLAPERSPHEIPGDPETSRHGPWHVREVLEWACFCIDRLAVATSFQSSGLVILHVMQQIRTDVPVLFLNTGFHFPETLSFAREITDLWSLNLIELRGPHGSPEGQTQVYGPDLFRRDPNQCCLINKIQPLQEELEHYDGWISGLRRDQSPSRSRTSIVETQSLPSGRELLKIHPLAHWTEVEVLSYIHEHGIPTHPLLESGYASIGCWPCTRAVRPGEDPRAGRWDGSSKTECGIHSFGRPDGPREIEAEQ
jgi:phosphoadenosine phosphosulfate reductase